MDPLDDLQALWRSSPAQTTAIDAPAFAARLAAGVSRERRVIVGKTAAVLATIGAVSWWLSASRPAPLVFTGIAVCLASAIAALASEWMLGGAALRVDYARPAAEFVEAARTSLARHRSGAAARAAFLTTGLVVGLNLIALGTSAGRSIGQRLPVHATCVAVPCAGYVAGLAIRRRRHRRLAAPIAAQLDSVSADLLTDEPAS